MILTDYQLFGNTDYYKSLIQHDVLLFEQCEHYKKGSYSNRYYIAGANGVLLLSVPLLHIRRGRTAIKDLKICNRNRWQDLHWKTLTSAYRRSPWFDFYEHELKVMYNKKYNYLLDWNVDAFDLVSRWIGKKWTVKMTEYYEKTVDENKMKDERHRFTPADLKVEKSENRVYYHQVFEDRNGFFPGLSILDLLFCEGPAAQKILLGKDI